MDSSKEINLRAHHGMCFKYFVGKGYSDGFTKNMAEMKALLEGTDPTVAVINSADTVCAKCPNLETDGCRSCDKVEKYDNGVLRACGIEPGTKMPYSEFSLLVTKNVIDKGLREKICGDCQWTSLCK